MSILLPTDNPITMLIEKKIVIKNLIKLFGEEDYFPIQIKTGQIISHVKAILNDNITSKLKL